MEERSLGAVPHDLFKVVRWIGHAGHRLVEREFPGEAKGKYVVDSQTLEQIIERHHYRRNCPPEDLWEFLWIHADCLSTVAARFRLEYDYWYRKQADPFFFRVYGDIKEWNKAERENLYNDIKEILVYYCLKPEEHARAFEKINELLSEFPADSRFPFTSLKTHHWLTHVLHNNEKFQFKVKEKPKSPKFENVYLLRISIAEPEFHKLKELRSFRELRFHILQTAKARVADWCPLQIGDDLYFVCLGLDEVNEVRQTLDGSGFGYDVDDFKWIIKRTKQATKPNGKKQNIYFVKECNRTPYSVGVYEKFEYAPKLAEYTDILEGEYDYVAWICIKPQGDMKHIAEEFLKNSEEKVLLKRYREKRIPLKEPVVIKAEEYLSPELALSIAEGYNEFLSDCTKIINETEPDACTIVKSFSEAWFVSGLKEPSDAFGIYTKLADKKEKLYMPILLVVTMAKPKYPFWRILELSKPLDADRLTFIVGDKMVELTGWHAQLIRNVIPFIQQERKRQFYRIVNAASRDDKEVLKVKIDGLASERKLSRETASKLCRLVDDVAEMVRRSGGGEESRKQTTGEIFKILRMFTQYGD